MLVVLAVASQIVAIGLLFLILAGLGVASIMLLLPLARQSSQGERIIKAFSNHFAWINNLPLWIERMVVSGTGIGCALLIDFPIQGISSPSDLFKGGVAAVLAIFAFIALCRWKRPFTRGDRFLVLINLLFCTFFFFAMNIPLIFLSLTGQIWNDNTFQPQIPAVFLFGITLLFIAFISFWWWTAHCQFSGNRRVLQIAFGVAFASGLLQLVVPSFLFTLLTLLALIMGMMIARISASSTP